MHFATKQWVGYDPAATHEAAGGYWTHRERQALTDTCPTRALFFGAIGDRIALQSGHWVNG
jgi:hypothetical protein